MSNLKVLVLVLGIILIRLGINNWLYYLNQGLDHSWAEALLMAIQHNEVFGKDFVFSYGPLGYLNFKAIGPSTSKWFLVAIEFFTIYQFVNIWKALSHKYPNHSWYFVCLILYLLFPFGMAADFSFSFLFFLLFWLYKVLTEKSFWPIFMSALIVVLLFFVKLNINLIVVAFFVVTLLLGWYLKRIDAIKVFLGISFIVVGIAVGATILNVSLVDYLQVIPLLVGGYPDAISEFIFTKKELIFYGILGLFLFLLIIKFIVNQFSWDYISLYFILVSLGILFLNHKQAHTALSPPNEYGFLNFLPWLMLFYWLLLGSSNRFQGYSISWILFLSLCFVGQQYYWLGRANFNLKQYVSNLGSFSIKPLDHFQEFLDYRYENHFLTNEKKLPDDLLKKIGGSSVDLFQQEIDYVFLNKLNYNHRPTVQSYQAFSPELMEMNAEKFRGNDSPEFVLYKSASFRKQNPMWVETPSTLALLKYYEVAGQYYPKNDTLLLLQKRKQALGQPIKFQSFDSVPFDQEIPVPQTDSILVATFDFQYNVLGKLAKFLFQPPYLYVRVRYENGTQEQFRVINQILRGGIILNRKITTQAELKQFFEKSGKENPKIVSITFYSPAKWGFKN